MICASEYHFVDSITILVYNCLVFLTCFEVNWSEQKSLTVEFPSERIAPEGAAVFDIIFRTNCIPCIVEMLHSTSVS